MSETSREKCSAFATLCLKRGFNGQIINENNTTKNMKYLIVVAHPDDEVLGAGASIRKWAHNSD